MNIMLAIYCSTVCTLLFNLDKAGSSHNNTKDITPVSASLAD